MNTCLLKEEWRDIQGYEGLYQISNYGIVKSLDKVRYDAKNGKSYKLGCKIRKVNICHNGYEYLCLNKNKNRKSYKVHQLVAMAFLNHKPCGMRYVIDHIDNNKRNNRVDNLRVLTNRDNLVKRLKDMSKNDGIYYRAKTSNFLVHAIILRKKKHIGTAPTLEIARKMQLDYYNKLSNVALYSNKYY